jgi:hypothetical protein
MENEIKIDEVQVTRLNLEPDEVLVVKVKSDRLNQANMEMLADQFRALLPDNNVVVLGMNLSEDIQLTTMGKPVNLEQKGE